MVKFLRTRLLAVVLGAALPFAAHAVPEIPQPGLSDIAIATLTPAGAVIYYNPVLCNQNLLFCRFARAHEYGHVALGHLGGVYPPMAEAQADCFAATHAAPAEVNAAVQLYTMAGMNGDMVHGTGFQRAQRIADAAMGRPCHF